MDPLNQNQQPDQMPPVQSQPESHKNAIGPIAGASIVILLIIAGGLYFWGAKLNSQNQNPPPFIPSDTTQTPSDTLQSDSSAGLPPQQSSDDVSSIQADMQAMDMNQLNAQNSAEMQGI